MAFLLLILILILPLIEIGVFIAVGGQIGVLPTLILTVATAVFGILCVRLQGFAVLGRLRAAAATGEEALVPLMEGALIAIAGVFLLIPGFLTDAAGLLLLVPPLRSGAARVIGARAATARAQGWASRGPGRGRRQAPPIIEGTAQEVDPDHARGPDPDVEPPHASRWGRRT